MSLDHPTFFLVCLLPFAFLASLRSFPLASSLASFHSFRNSFVLLHFLVMSNNRYHHVCPFFCISCTHAMSTHPQLFAMLMWDSLRGVMCYCYLVSGRTGCSNVGAPCCWVTAIIASCIFYIDASVICTGRSFAAYITSLRLALPL